MAVVQRLLRLWQAHLHSILDRMEDRELLLNQNLCRMKDALKLRELRLSEMPGARGKASALRVKIQRQISRLESDLNLAVGKDQDDIARELLRKLHELRYCLDELEKRIGGPEEEEKYTSRAGGSDSGRGRGVTQLVRKTILFGGASGLLFAAMLTLLPEYYGSLPLVRLIVASNLVVYSLFLCRWNVSSYRVVLLPLTAIVVATIWPVSYASFLLLALLVFSWARSSICSDRPGVRQCVAEALTLGGFVWVEAQMTILSGEFMPLMIWLFFLFQALYFYLLPGSSIKKDTARLHDEFEQASLEVERLLREPFSVS